MWNKFEHHVWQQLNKYKLEKESKYLLAVSGGMDSSVLIHVFSQLRPRADLILMHFHHGFSDQVPVVDYRNQTIKSLQGLQNEKIVLEFDQATEKLSSEAEFRNARCQFFAKILEKHQLNFYITAHHKDDVLETRLLKMIRGTGLDSLSAFKIWNFKIFRPLLDISKKEIHDYGIEKKIPWVEDPTNYESIYLRNWIRNEWLPLLDQKAPGSLNSLSQSLNNIVSEIEDQAVVSNQKINRYIIIDDLTVTIDRTWFVSLDASLQIKVLVQLIKNHFKTEFSHSQLKEIIKQLDKNQNEHTFKAAGIIWLTNRNNIMLK